VTAARATSEWSIQEIARAAGTTSRTLRYYDERGLLRPSRVGSNGYRYYDQESLVRLQRILLLRDLGLGLDAIAEVLDGEQDSRAALRAHLDWLEHERARLARQIASVRRTLDALEKGEPIMADEAFDGFDHTQYKDEVVQRWGKEAYESSDRWWRSLSKDEQREFQRRQESIAADYAKAYQAGETPASKQVQEITRRHLEWITNAWGGKQPSAEQFTCIGQMYVDDPRFTKNYDKHGEGTAAFVRDAMKAYAEANL